MADVKKEKKGHHGSKPILVVENTGKQAKSMYTSLKPDRQNSHNSTSSADLSSVGYEELPRLQTRKKRHEDNDSLSSWDDNTVTTNSSV